MTGHVCEECRTPWDSLSAANECATLDAAEAREARRPARAVPAITRWPDD